jgi:6-pyruvoyl-tetrahydropterin synthase
MSETSINVRHNIEVAHRLIETRGKCEAIHGHSMWVTLTLWGDIDKTGKLNGLEFGLVKAIFRDYLDKNFDHHLLLNLMDTQLSGLELPGAHILDCDPTTENIAATIGQWAESNFASTRVRCEVQETPVNGAAWER